MNVRICTRLALLLLLGFTVATPLKAHAVPVEYRIAGLLSGLGSNLFDPFQITDAPFEITFAADTEDAFDFGQIPGFGSAYVNNSTSAKWTVEGFDVAFSTRAQVFTLPGVASVGFGWNGDIFPLNSADPAELTLRFLNSVFATDLAYGRLGSVVPPVSLTLQTDLENPPGVIPTFTRSVLFPEKGRLALTELKGIRYEVVAVPEPGTVTLVGLGMTVLCALRRLRDPICLPSSLCLTSCHSSDPEKGL